MLRASCLKLEINEFRCYYEAKIEESEKGKPLAAQARGVLGSTPSGCRPFSLSSILMSPHNILIHL